MNAKRQKFGANPPYLLAGSSVFLIQVQWLAVHKGEAPNVLAPPPPGMNDFFVQEHIGKTDHYVFSAHAN
jgi:hypothetical protein